MKIVIIGGSGLIGSKLVKRLQAKGHTAVAASPASGVNTLTGEGLSAALEGVDVMVDVSNSPSFADAEVMSFFQTSTKNLLNAELAAGVKHHVALSVVGSERNPESGYLRAKVAQEEAIKAGKVPFSILRSTQFFEFVGRIVDAATTDHTVKMSPANMQPIAADDVVAALADLALGEPVGGIVEVAGPELIKMDELAWRFLRFHDDDRRVISDVHARYFGAEVTDQSLTPGPTPRLGRIAFGQWLEDSRLK